MPKRATVTPIRPADSLPAPERASSLFRSVESLVSGLLVLLIGTGIISMIVLYANVTSLTHQVDATSAALARHLDHSVDKDVYEKRDAAIQQQLNTKASKDEIRELREEIRNQLIDLKETIHTVQEGFGRKR